MTITLPLRSFLICLTYHEPFGHAGVTNEVAEAVRLADPHNELTHIEFISGGVELTHNVWRKEAWENELRRRDYINNLSAQLLRTARKAVEATKQPSNPKEILAHQLALARENNANPNVIESLQKAYDSL